VGLFAILPTLIIANHQKLEMKSLVVLEKIAAAKKLKRLKKGQDSPALPLISNLESVNPDTPEQVVQ